MPRNTGQRGSKLLQAVREGDADEVKKLLEEGEDPNKPSGHFKSPPLVCMMLFLAIAKLLVKYGADVNGTDADGNTALHLNQTPEVIRFLISEGANTEGKEFYGFTAIHLHLDNPEVTEALLEGGANPNTKDKSTKSPLHKVERRDVAELLLKHGANPNIQDKYGYTPLHKAGNKELKDIVLLLLEKGADKKVKDRQGLTAWSYSDNEEIDNLLECEYEVPSLEEMNDLFILHARKVKGRYSWKESMLLETFYHLVDWESPIGFSYRKFFSTTAFPEESFENRLLELLTSKESSKEELHEYVKENYMEDLRR